MVALTLKGLYTFKVEKAGRKALEEKNEKMEEVKKKQRTVWMMIKWG